MRGFAQALQLFEAFPDNWFVVATVAKYADVSKDQASIILAEMCKYGMIDKDRQPDLHSQAWFYRSAKNRRNGVLQNHSENRRILAGEARSVEMRGVQSEPYYTRRVSNE